MNNAVLRPVRADDLDWIAHHHQVLYARDEGFDETFGPLVSRIVADFLADHDPSCEAGWIAEAEGARLGCIFCVRQGKETAKLRLFFLLPQARGLGLGKTLLRTCMAFAKASGYRDMTLWTHESHRAACALYRAFGWQLTDSKPVHSFGVDLVEQTWCVTL